MKPTRLVAKMVESGSSDKHLLTDAGKNYSAGRFSYRGEYKDAPDLCASLTMWAALSYAR
jgi:hypothetical protein